MRYIIGAVAFVALIGFGSWGCREAQINDCEDKGGQAVTRAWWAGDWTDVRCVEPFDVGR